MWRASDLVECVIFIGLAVMLAYTAFVVVRFFRRYFSARRTSFVLFADCTPSSEQSKKNFVADLSRGVGTLQSIAFAAPFLGLAGTCYGILCLFARGWVFKWWSPTQTSVALVATAAGLIVAIPAAISYNILRTCLEKFENGCSNTLLEATPRSYGFAQTLALRRRFSRMPAFALIGVPVLATLLLFMLIILGPRISTGLTVHIAKIGVNDHDSSPIIISVMAANGSGQSTVYVNAKETPWNELRNTLRSQLKLRPHWIVYVEGEEKVPFADVANVIDVARGLRAEVVLLTVTPDIGSDRARHTRPKKKLE